MAVEGASSPTGRSVTQGAESGHRQPFGQNRGGSTRPGRFLRRPAPASIADCTADRPRVNGAAAPRYMADALADRAADPGGASENLGFGPTYSTPSLRPGAFRLNRSCPPNRAGLTGACKADDEPKNRASRSSSDSPLEESGFEPVVPATWQTLSRAS